MNDLMDIGLTNAASALILALAALLIAPRLRRPQLVHALWLVVLLDLLTPPIVRIGILPRIAQAPSIAAASATVPLPSGATLRVLAPDLDRTATTTAAAFPRALWIGWAGGAGLVLLLALVRALRFRQLLARATPAPPELTLRAERLARRIGLARAPRIRLVPAPISPLLRPRLGRAEVLFPRDLAAGLSDRECDAILAHEMAHVARRDHWVRFVELAASALFFWHPAVWWARPRLRRAEERASDDRVVRHFPDLAADLARGLVKTVEFLSATPRPLPCLASGAVGVEDLKERLTMILKPRSLRPLTRLEWLTLSTLALAALLVFPTRAAETTAKQRVEQRQKAEQAEQAEQAKQIEQVDQIERRQRERIEAELSQARDQVRRIGDDEARERAEREIARSQRVEEARRAREPREPREVRELQEKIRADVERQYAELLENGELRAAMQADVERALAQHELELTQMRTMATSHALREVQERIAGLMQAAARLDAQGRQNDLDELNQHLEDLRREVERAAEVQ
jgi:beta-lactamase regulating signal transducer with metallopeptidase domain